MTLPPQLQLPLPSSFTFHIALNLTLQVCAFLLSMSDKLVAKGVFPFRGLQRVPEKAFYVVTFFGGLPGLVASFVILRHKTHYRKRTFRRNMKLCAFLAMVLTRRINILTIIACFF